MPTPPDRTPAIVSHGSLEAHRLLVVSLFISTLVVGIPFLAAALLFAEKERYDLVVTPFTSTLIAGAGGGFVSSLRRLYAFGDVFPRSDYGRLFQRLDSYVVAYSCVPALVGMIGAAVLYLIFAGQLLEGGLFPKFGCLMPSGAPGVAEQCRLFHDFVTRWSPIDADSYARMIVWGFVAGFSERVVPDILNRMSAVDAPGA